MTTRDAGPGEAGQDGWFETVSSEVRYDGMFARVRVDDVRMPGGEVSAREVVEQLPAAAVVPLLDDGEVLLLRQYRHPVGRYVLEIPAGKLDEDSETPEQTAARELVEETGYRAGRLEHVTTFLNSAGWTDESTYVYLGHDLRQEGLPDAFDPSAEEADMEVVRMPLETAVEASRRGDITDAKTVIGLLLAAT